MEARVLLFIAILGTSWCCNARVVTTNPSPLQNGIASELHKHKQEEEGKVEGICTLCEGVIGPILESLSRINQTELTASFHLFCSLTFAYKDECNAMVDYYVPLIFNGSSTLTPEMLCTEIGLCENVVFTSQHLPINTCEFCQAVKEASLQLRHSHFQIHIVKLLLKSCLEGSVKNCKGLVFTRAPLISIYAKKLLQGNDICALLNACTPTSTKPAKQTSMISAY